MNKLLGAAVPVLLCPLGTLTGQARPLLGPSSSLPQIVTVRVLRLSEPLEGQGIGYGSGIVIGKEVDGDLLIVTAAHAVEKLADTTRVVVGIGMEDRRVTADLVGLPDPDTDLAILRITNPDWVNAGNWTLRAPSMLTVNYRYHAGARVFVLGCPFGECWASPVEARIVRLQPDRLDVRTASRLQGHSGGALVDERGLIIGVFTSKEDVGLSSVIKWPAVVRWLGSRGVVPNLPARTLVQTGNFSVVFNYAPLDPRGGKHPDGSRTWPATTFELGYRLYGDIDVIGGYQFVSVSHWYIDAPSESFLGHFLSVGVRRSIPLDLGTAGERPATVIFGINRLTGLNHQLLVLESVPDSFDLRTGLPILRYVERYATGNGWSFDVGLRGHVYRGLVLQIGASFTTFSLRESDLFRNQMGYTVGFGFVGGPKNREFSDEISIESLVP